MIDGGAAYGSRLEDCPRSGHVSRQAQEELTAFVPLVPRIYAPDTKKKIRSIGSQLPLGGLYFMETQNTAI